MTTRTDFSFADMEKWLNDKRVTEVECLVPDLTGVARGKILPRGKFTEDRGMRMPDAVLAMTVTGEYPGDDPDYNDIISEIDADMMLRPDPNTVRLVPWATDPTAQVIHDCYDKEGELIEFAPRTVLKKVLALYAAKGWHPIVAPELEFYIVAKNTDPDLPLKPPIGRSGRAETSRQVYSIDAVNEFDPLFEEIYEHSEAMELELDTLIHEMGAGQMEVNFLHNEPLGLADKVFYFKRLVRETALRHDMYATFMAKPMADEPGSAMHVHQSVLDDAGKNIFSNADGSASDLFHNYIAGLQKYTPATMAFAAPYVNSYRRITRDSAAPINVQWGYDNRTVGFRVPHSDPSNRRIENRIIGVDANPYLALAATLAAGYLGMTEGLKPTAESKGSAYNLDFELPRNLFESLDALKASEPIRKVLGDRFVRLYCSVKQLEYAEFMKVISPWEREHLLLHV